MYTMISLWLKICFQQPGEKHQNLFLFENSICCYATWNIKVEHQRYFISNPGSIMLPELASIPSPISLHVRAYIRLVLCICELRSESHLTVYAES